MEKEIIVSASYYKKKYFFNEKYSALPEKIRNEIRTICIFAADKVRGVFTVGIYENGDVSFETLSEELDFDEINAKYIINKIQDEKENMIKALSAWYILNR